MLDDSFLCFVTAVCVCVGVLPWFLELLDFVFKFVAKVNFKQFKMEKKKKVLLNIRLNE